MLTVLWDNDGVLVDTEGLYFQACSQVLGSVGIDLTLDRFKRHMGPIAVVKLRPTN